MKPVTCLQPPSRRWSESAPRILCADGDKRERCILLIVFSRAGFNCETVSDGETAFEMLMADPDDIDVLVTGHDMPRLNGLNLVRQLREKGFSRKIVVHSPDLRIDERAAYEALSVDAILTRPLDRGTLLEAISTTGPDNSVEARR